MAHQGHTLSSSECTSIKLYNTLQGCSQEAYNRAQEVFIDTNPGLDVLSYFSVEKLVENITGVIRILTDMCPNTCVAYTGPYSDLNMCPTCELSHWGFKSTQHRNVPTQQFATFPLGLQLQAGIVEITSDSQRDAICMAKHRRCYERGQREK